MQYDVSSPEEFLETIEDDWRKPKLLIIRDMLFAAEPDLIEGIQYKMLSYSDNNGVICHLNAQKNFVALYVGNADKIDIDGSMLKDINRGKGCLRFSKTLDPKEAGIAQFIQKMIELRKSGADIDC